MNQLLNHVSILGSLADVIANGGRGTGRGSVERRLFLRRNRIRSSPRNCRFSAAWRWGGQKRGWIDRTPKILHRLEKYVLIDEVGPIRRGDTG